MPWAAVSSLLIPVRDAGEERFGWGVRLERDAHVDHQGTPEEPPNRSIGSILLLVEWYLLILLPGAPGSKKGLCWGGDPRFQEARERGGGGGGEALLWDSSPG